MTQATRSPGELEKSDEGRPEVVIVPGPASWATSLRKPLALSREQRVFREELGLPVDRPLVMSGHQAEIWHPGILAKLLATSAAARSHGAAPVWLVVDTDTNDPLNVRYPSKSADGALSARVWRVGDQRGGRASHVPTGRMPAVRPAALPADARSGASPGVEAGLERIRGALHARSGEVSAARQLALAAMELSVMHCGGATPTIVYASELSRTSAFAGLLEKMTRDPCGVIGRYNRHVREHAGSGLAPLPTGELPVWRIGAGMGALRQRVSAPEIRASEPGMYAPRALLLTGMVRWLGCELFVHGTGGAGRDGASGYDYVTARWLGDWLGATLAPGAMVTATMRLRFQGAHAPSPDTIDRAAWTAHAARHRPELLGDQRAAEATRALVARLQTLRGRRGGGERSEKLRVYRELHRALDDSRVRNAPRLAELRDHARDLAGRRETAGVVDDRTWAFPLYESAQLSALSTAISRGLGAPDSASTT